MKKDYWRLRIMSWRCTATSVMAMTFGICRTPCRALASYIPMAHHFKPAPVDAEHFPSVWNAFTTEDFGVRYLHVSEAAVLCGFPPRFQFIGTGRDSLCYVGQCASPVQSLWMMANFFHTTNPEVQPIVSLTAYIMYIMKELHGSFQFRALPAQVGFCRVQGDHHQDSMMATPATTIGDWKKAEQKLLDRGQYVQISDEQGSFARRSTWLLLQQDRYALPFKGKTSRPSTLPHLAPFSLSSLTSAGWIVPCPGSMYSRGNGCSWMYDYGLPPPSPLRQLASQQEAYLTGD